MAFANLVERLTSRGFHRPAALAALGLLTAFAVLAVASVREKSGTYDELFHVTGGYTSWVKDDFRIHNTNGNLVQRWIALPLLGMNLDLPPGDSPGWQRPAYFGIEFGHQFFFRSGNDPDAMLRQARAMVVILGVALAALTGLWSRRLFGRRGGLVSLALFAFSPTMLAHGQIATSDMAAALAFTASTWCLWTLLHRLTPATFASSCLVVGAAAAVKFSTPMLGLVAAAMAAVRVVRDRPWTMRLGGRTWLLRGRLASVGVVAALGAAHLLAAAAVIWACYGWRYSAFAEAGDGPGEFCDPWSTVMEMRSRVAAGLIAFCRDWRLLPEAYLHGLAHTLRFSEERPAYFLGDCSRTGWWAYHPYCYWAKTTLATHALTLLGVAAIAWRSRGWFRWSWRAGLASLYRLTPLAALLVVYWTAAIRSNLNLGVRHVLPVYPATLILAGAAAIWTWRQARPASETPVGGGLLRRLLRDGWRPMAALVGLLLAIHVLEAALVYPNFLAYFNVAVGGPRQGYRQLVDSNLDWGQDLPGLAKWQRNHRRRAADDRPFYLEYLGSSSPEHYGIEHVPLRVFLAQTVAPGNIFPLRGGVYCLSATVVAGPNEPVPRWSREHEARLRELLRLIQSVQPTEENWQAWERCRRECAALEFARLLAFLREREPDDHVNHSLHIYELTDDDIAAAMRGPLQELDP
jgi:hypothetical protein